MVINWYGEGCFKIQTGGLTLLTDPEVGPGLTSPRGKTEAVLKTLTGWPIPSTQKEGVVLLGPGEYEVQDVEISGIPVPKESTPKFFKTIYLVQAEGLNLCFLGYLAEYPEPGILEQLKTIDIMFIPAGGKPFIKQELAAKLIKQLDPKIVVASFFKIPGLKRPSDDAKDFAKEIGHQVNPEEKLVVKKKDVTEQKGLRFVVLKV